MNKSLVNSTQTASLTLNVTNPAVLRYIRAVGNRTGLTMPHIAAELLRDGAERAAGCYAAVRIPKPPKPPKPPRSPKPPRPPKKHGTGEVMK